VSPQRPKLARAIGGTRELAVVQALIDVGFDTLELEEAKGGVTDDMASPEGAEGKSDNEEASRVGQNQPMPRAPVKLNVKLCQNQTRRPPPLQF
jgi:hypothetical protein